jgi:glutamate 5-kinase
LVLLSDIDGLYDKDPRKYKDAKLVGRVTAVTDALRSAAGGAGTARGTGGMQTKLDAAAIALAYGIDMVITNGAKPELLYGIAAGAEVGTRFCAKKEEEPV